MQECVFCGRTVNHVHHLIRSMRAENVYICDKCVSICSYILDQANVSKESEDKPFMTEGIGQMTPSRIKAEFDRFIIGQEEAKKVLSVAIYNHNKRLRDTTGLVKKSNILLIGPSGCGKTLLAKTLAKMLNLPFTIADATSLTEAGYVGDDVEVCLQRLLEVADGDVELAQKGIVYIDEIDKIARMGESRSITRDVSGEGVQASLLKLIEGCEVSVPVSGRRKHPQGENVTFNTSNVLFICGGAFDGLLDSGAKRKTGFSSTGGFEMTNDGEDSGKVTDKALKKYGMMPELIGRLQVRCELSELGEDELVRVLTEPEDAITKEYQLLFELDGIKLTYDESAYREIAKAAIEKGSGARGLRTILENAMLDIMYSVPDESDVEECIITKESIRTKKAKMIKKKIA